MRFKEVFKRLNGREAVAEDVLKFERLTTALETTPGDAMLAVLVALDHYETLYGTIPAKITATATDTLSSFKRSADAQAAASIAEAKADLAKAVSEVAVKVAHNTSAKQMWQWAGGCIAVAFMSLGRLVCTFQRQGFRLPSRVRRRLHRSQRRKSGGGMGEHARGSHGLPLRPVGRTATARPVQWQGLENRKGQLLPLRGSH
jgi:hypothetical protein